MEPLGETPLAGRRGADLAITASARQLRPHMARLLLDDQRLWATIDIATDAELLAAQLTEGESAARRIYAEPSLLVLRLGVKRSKNESLAGLILTALAAREDMNRPTWIVIDPLVPLQIGLPAWSQELEMRIAEWFQISLAGPGQGAAAASPPVSGAAPPVGPAPAPAPTAAPKREPHPAVAEAAQLLGWTPDKIDKRGSGWGDCPAGCGGRFSVFVGDGGEGDTLGKCHSEEKCPLRATTTVAKVAAKLAAKPAAAPAGTPAAAFLATRFGAAGAAVARAELETEAKAAGIGWRSVERAKGALAAQGQRIDAQLREGVWHWVRVA